MEMSFEMKGGRELEQVLKRLDVQAEAKVAGTAVGAGGRLFKNALTDELYLYRGTGPQPGMLAGRPRKDIKIHESVGVRKVNKVESHVGVFGPAQFYAHILEFGSIFHAPRPVWRTLFESMIQQMLDAMAARAWKEIEKGVKR